MAARQKLDQNETLSEKIKKFEKRIKLKYPDRFGKLNAAFDGLISIHNFFDKLKEIDKEIDAMVLKRDNGVLEHVTTMREGQGLGDLAL